MNDEVVTRLYRCLVEELDRRGIPEGRPVKVSELYQALVPYRAVRSALGVELNADYEHALLRLLAGERSLLRLEPAQARDELRREVDAPYPFVGLFRKFSASNVWVNRPERPMTGRPEEPAAPARAPDPLPEPTRSVQSIKGPELDPDPAPAAEPVAEPEPAPAVEPATPTGPERGAGPGDKPAQRLAAEAENPAPADVDTAAQAEAATDAVPLSSRRLGSLAPARMPVQLHREPERAESASEAAVRGGPCTFCGDTMPGGRRIRFCPYCGADQRMRPCPRCDAVLERDWRFCISCGHDAKQG